MCVEKTICNACFLPKLPIKMFLAPNVHPLKIDYNRHISNKYASSATIQHTCQHDKNNPNETLIPSHKA